MLNYTDSVVATVAPVYAFLHNSSVRKALCCRVCNNNLFLSDYINADAIIAAYIRKSVSFNWGNCDVYLCNDGLYCCKVCNAMLGNRRAFFDYTDDFFGAFLPLYLSFVSSRLRNMLLDYIAHSDFTSDSVTSVYLHMGDYLLAAVSEFFTTDDFLYLHSYCNNTSADAVVDVILAVVAPAISDSDS